MNDQTTVLEKSFLKTKAKKKEQKAFDQKPTAAFIGASWLVWAIGMISFCVGLWNSNMELNEKGYYFTVLLFGLFSSISVQKAVRDQLENVQVTAVYYGISWFTTITSMLLLIIGLWNAELLQVKKILRNYILLSLFGAITVQASRYCVWTLMKRKN